MLFFVIDGDIFFFFEEGRGVLFAINSFFLELYWVSGYCRWLTSLRRRRHAAFGLTYTDLDDKSSKKNIQ